ncbi:response regulator transcription factor [Bacteriovorax sp. PP10]|uniref:Response regulator transcription factor n=1 Tax=Bacteriovorax antarcticus TaxID=3088717 RepID=A0ABU5VW17_9BACT|nr:response regulator transcription factor [Bacteriovorax sp. PP10]MEA9357244.1 response regulator transcription factor [Bacteriovorax sp. PP10]
MNSITDVIICDDHYISAVGIESLLKKILNEKIRTRLSSSGEEGLALFHEQEPDLMLLDLGLPKKSGLDVLKEVIPLSKKCKFVVLTGADDPALFQQVLKQNIHGLLRKSNSEQNIREVINFFEEGKAGVYIDPSVAGLLKVESGFPLTPREYEVLELMSRGHTSQEIADLLSCSLSTIKTYRMRIMNKSGARNSSEMIAWFFKKEVNR